MVTNNENIFYKTTPRLLILSLSLLGGVFSGLLSILILTSSFEKYTLLIYSLFIFFFISVFIALYYLLKIKIIYLTDKELVIKYLFLPLSHSYLFSEIVTMKQFEKQSYVYLDGISFGKTYYTIYKTIIELKDGNIIELWDITDTDFDNLSNAFFKLKRGEGRVTVHRIDWRMYVFDNLSGIFVSVFLLFLITGLSLALLFGD